MVARSGAVPRWMIQHPRIARDKVGQMARCERHLRVMPHVTGGTPTPPPTTIQLPLRVTTVMINMSIHHTHPCVP